MRQPTKIAVFQTTRLVIKADVACEEAGIPIRIVPVPPAISSDCGMCLEIAEPLLSEFTKLMESLAIEMKIYDYNFL